MAKTKMSRQELLAEAVRYDRMEQAMLAIGDTAAATYARRMARLHRDEAELAHN